MSMWPGRGQEAETVTCIGCGDRLERADAREYDKHGDRWERTEKSFEYLCKDCFADISKQSRDGQEALLCDVGAGTVSDEEFLARYCTAVEGSGRGDTTN